MRISICLLLLLNDDEFGSRDFAAEIELDASKRKHSVMRRMSSWIADRTADVSSTGQSGDSSLPPGTWVWLLSWCYSTPVFLIPCLIERHAPSSCDDTLWLPLCSALVSSSSSRHPLEHWVKMASWMRHETGWISRCKNPAWILSSFRCWMSYCCNLLPEDPCPDPVLVPFWSDDMTRDPGSRTSAAADDWRHPLGQVMRMADYLGRWHRRTTHSWVSCPE